MEKGDDEEGGARRSSRPRGKGKNAIDLLINRDLHCEGGVERGKVLN